MSFPISLLYFLSILCLSLSLTTTITLPLYHTPSKHPFHHLTYLASHSLLRARNIKNATTDAPLSTHSYGGYSIPLAFGTPPQILQFVFDTGSDVVWFPCTHKYLCNNCSFSGDLPLFIPKLSSSARILGCLNHKCGWIHHTNASQCTECRPGTKNCTEICPPYMILYGSGNTGGFGLVDTLNLPVKKCIISGEAVYVQDLFKRSFHLDGDVVNPDSQHKKCSYQKTAQERTARIILKTQEASRLEAAIEKSARNQI